MKPTEVIVGSIVLAKITGRWMRARVLGIGPSQTIGGIGVPIRVLSPKIALANIRTSRVLNPRLASELKSIPESRLNPERRPKITDVRGNKARHEMIVSHVSVAIRGFFDPNPMIRRAG